GVISFFCLLIHSRPGKTLAGMNTDFVGNSAQKIWDFLRASPHSPWLQLCIAAVLLLVLVFCKGFSGGAAIETGLHICYFWIPLCAVLSLFVADFWLYILHWVVCTLAFFIIYFLTIYLCEKYGRSY